MRRRYNRIMICLMALLLCLFTACGGTGQGKDTSEDADMETTEEVTAFDKEQTTISFGDIENGINFKAAGDAVTFQFEDIDAFDNSLAMEFSLSDASYEQEPVALAIEEGKAEYRFDGLEEGKEYYLEVYPTESAGSDSEYAEIQEKNSACQLQLIQ